MRICGDAGYSYSGVQLGAGHEYKRIYGHDTSGQLGAMLLTMRCGSAQTGRHGDLRSSQLTVLGAGPTQGEWATAAAGAHIWGSTLPALPLPCALTMNTSRSSEASSPRPCSFPLY